MKTIRKYFVTLISGFLSSGLLLCLTACSGQSPIAPESDNKLNFIELIPIGGKATTLNKMIVVSDSVTYQNGGQLFLNFMVKGKDTVDVHAIINLVILPHSVNEDTELSLSLDEETLLGNVDVTFAPHGIEFMRPAILNIQARGLELSGIDPAIIDIYYDNPELGEWEKMPRKQVVVNEKNGFINVVAAEIPHFSRYAVAWSE
jgi:hypothetical protein